VEAALPGLTIRMALFFLFHAALATWAALYWSTTAWALLKGLGFTGSFILYMLVEVIFLRRKARRSLVALQKSENDSQFR
jgi:intracellular septation protein